MRYIKVLLGVLFFFIVMLFFVQNQVAFSQEMMLKLDMLFFTVESSSPVHFYALLLISFLVGALVCFSMLIWDRLALVGRVGFSKMKIRSLEHDVEKAAKARATLEKTLEETQAKLAEGKTQLGEAQSKNAELEKALALVPSKK